MHVFLAVLRQQIVVHFRQTARSCVGSPTIKRMDEEKCWRRLGSANRGAINEHNSSVGT
jgi:hypothetical protein